MIPRAFSTEVEITKKLRRVGNLHIFENAQTISHIFYDVFKMAYLALNRKKSGIRKVNSFPVLLRRREVTRLVKIVHYHHCHDKTFTATHELMQCFGSRFSEADALKFFENYVEGETKDKYGRLIRIDLEDGAKFLYKDNITGRHDMATENYKPERGKRLPWIKHTIHNTSNIYTKIDGHQREIMYVSKYDLPSYDGESNKNYWVVIVKKNKKDKVSPYNFKTAFPIFVYNSLLARLERYEPITQVPHLIKNPERA